MARIRNGILGGFSNKVGEVIGQNYGGLSIMRAMPKYVSNPRTPAQESHRARMALAGSFLCSFTRGFSFSSWNMTSVNNGFNGSLRANFSNFVFDPVTGPDVDLLSLDMGTYVGVPLTSTELVSALLDDVSGNIELTMRWDNDNPNEWASGNDTIILFAVVEHQTYKPGEKYTPLYCDVLPVERADAGTTAYIYVGDSVAVGDIVYVAFGVVAQCMVRTGHNPQKPIEVIKIPAKNNPKPSSPSGKPKTMMIPIPAKNVVKFSAGQTLKKAVAKKT